MRRKLVLEINVEFDPLPIILGVAGILLLILVLLCFYAIKKALDIANRDKVIVFQGKVLLTEDQMKHNRGQGLRNHQMRVS